MIAVLLGALGTATAVTQTQDAVPLKSGSGFRAGVDLVTLHVSVRDRKNRLITDATEAEFSVFENGLRQELRFFQPSGLPLALTLMLDTSASMHLAAAQSATIGLISRMGPDDVASVVTFDETMRVLQDFTNDRAALTAAVGQAARGGTTSLYTAVYTVLRELEKIVPVSATNPSRHRAILIVSDGDDSTSVVPFEQLLDAATRSDATIYAIRLLTTALPDVRMRTAVVLKRLAEQTGGRAFFPIYDYELPRIYAAIASELSSQYTIAYESDRRRRDGRFRTLSVQIARLGAAARTRRGYYASPH